MSCRWLRRSLTALISALLVGCSTAPVGEQPGGRPDHLMYGVPKKPDLLIRRRGYSLGYDHRTRQALWVCYLLAAEDVTGGKVARAGKFRRDPAVAVRPVEPREYNRSGFDRGHLAPAGDMIRSDETMTQSFFMTNISPQIPGCNRGIWKRLETQVRRWAVREGRICVITGPIFSSDARRVGRSDIPVPSAFFKVILDTTPPRKMIGFIVPNAPSRKQPTAFAVSVDTVEELTGYDFFSALDDAEEDALERSVDIDAWK